MNTTYIGDDVPGAPISRKQIEDRIADLQKANRSEHNWERVDEIRYFRQILRIWDGRGISREY